MSTCKYKKNDYIAHKFHEKELYCVVGVKEFDIVLRRENLEDLEKFTDEDLLEMDTHEVNNKFSKVDLETYKLLHQDDKDVPKTNSK